MNTYTVTVTSSSTDDYSDDDIDRIVATLAGVAGVPYTNPRGHREATITVDARNAAAAIADNLSAVTRALGGRAVNVQVTDDKHVDAATPDVVSVADASLVLGYSIPRINQLIADGTIPATRIGKRAWAIPAAALNTLPHRIRKTA